MSHAETEIVASGLDVPEGPVSCPDGSVIFVEIRGGRVSRLGPDGVVSTVAAWRGGPNGAAFAPDGRLFVCDNGGAEWEHLGGALYLPAPHRPDAPTGRIRAVDLRTGEVETVYARCGERLLVAPNDLVFDEHGGFYFTDFGRVHADTIVRGTVYYATADGGEIHPVATGLDRPNGCALSPSGDVLYVSETATGRLWWWRVAAPGVLEGGLTYRGAGGGNLLYAAPGYDRFDSMAVEENGNVCVATYFHRGVTVVSPEGELVEVVEFPGDPVITNICFAGDGHTAYVTSAGKGVLYRRAWPRKGLVLPAAGGLRP